MKHITIVYNAKSGGSSTDKSEIESAFTDSDTVLLFVPIGEKMHRDVARAVQKGTDVLVAAGGDGTVNAVAALAVQHNIPLGVLPAGTLNHFAKDLGLPQDIPEAAKVITAGHTRAVDYATVNDKVFVNNSSIGLYPSTVLRRDKISAKLSKWPAAFVAAIITLFNVRSTHLTLSHDNTEQTVLTPLVFVGNNIYKLDKIGFADRHSLDSGQLFLYIVHANRVTALCRLAVVSLLGKRLKKGDTTMKITDNFCLKSPKQTLQVAVDGEVISLQPPLIYKMHHKQLTVCSPQH